MKRLFAALLVVVSTIAVASAQPPGEHGGPRGERGGPEGEHGGGGRRSPNAILAAIDSNGDHEITRNEMKNAFTALKNLDANKNGKLDRDEIHPEMAGGRGDSRGRGQHEGHGGLGGPGGETESKQAVAERLQSFDKNNDGKLTKEEIPTRMHQVAARFDKNSDSVLDAQELSAMSEQLATSGPDGDGRRGRGGFDGPPGGHGQGGGQRGGGGGRGGPGGPGGGPPSPEQMIQDAFEFDANKDGLLSKSELERFAKSVSQRGGPGGGQDGGPGGSRRGRGGDRPSRPTRPE